MQKNIPKDNLLQLSIYPQAKISPLIWKLKLIHEICVDSCQTEPKELHKTIYSGKKMAQGS